MNTVFFLMPCLDSSSPALALAHCLAQVRFGYWSDDRRTFSSDLSQSGQGLSIKWGIDTRVSHDMGTAYITFQGDHIVSFRFVQAWPNARFLPGLYSIDSRLSSPVIDSHDCLPCKTATLATLSEKYGLVTCTGTSARFLRHSDARPTAALNYQHHTLQPA
jgi:hypothetical protein